MINEGVFINPKRNVWELSYNTKMKLLPIPYPEINNDPEMDPGDQNPGY